MTEEINHENLNAKPDVQPVTPPPPQPVASMNRAASNITINVDKIDEIAAYVSKARQPESYNAFVPFTVVPESMKLLDLEHKMPHPSRIRAHETFKDVDSFLAYFALFASPFARLFAVESDNGLTVRCVFDYHVPSQQQGDLPLAQWKDHVADLVLTYSDDYKALRKLSGQWMSQRDFALFVEQNLHLFVEPTGGDMLELAQNLRGTKNVAWENGKRLDNGAVSLQYVENINATTRSSMEVPQQLVMLTKLYDGLDPVQIEAGFSYDIDDDRNLNLQFRLKTKLQERDAMAAVKAKLAEGTQATIMNVTAFGN